MLAQTSVNGTEWTELIANGACGVAWLDEDGDGAVGASDVVIVASESEPGTEPIAFAKRLRKPQGNRDALPFALETETMKLWGRCITASAAARVTIDSQVAQDAVRIRQASYSRDALLSTSYADDFIVRGKAFQVQRRIENIPNGTAYKSVIDFSGVDEDKIIFMLPVALSSTGGPMYIQTYAITSYTGGTVLPVNKMNYLLSNESQAVVKKGVTTSDVAGTDVREYELGALGNPQQVNRAGNISGAASALIFPPGGILCLDVLNQYTEALPLIVGLVWYEI
jgi:hypothetical protein